MSSFKKMKVQQKMGTFGSLPTRVDPVKMESETEKNPEPIQIVRSVSSTTKKHAEFVKGPMGDKDVSAIAGVGGATEDKLKVKSITKAYQLLGLFLTLNKESTAFKNYLLENFGIQDRESTPISICLTEWVTQYL